MVMSLFQVNFYNWNTLFGKIFLETTVLVVEMCDKMEIQNSIYRNN